MERSSSFLLILMLTESVSYSFESPVKAGTSPEAVLLEEGTPLRIKAFCGYQNLKGKKVWCKDKLKEDCYHNTLLNSPGSEWNYLTTKSNEHIILEGSANGCISLLMSPLQVEDSGTYWFGIQNKTTFVFLEKISVVVHKSPPTPAKILPPTSTIAFSERPSKAGKEEEVMKMEGESLKMEIFCSQQYLQAVKMWCKGDLLKECNPTEPVTLSGWKPLTTEPNQRVVLEGSGNGCFSLLMSTLKAEDSGTYWFGILDGLNVTPLRKIKVIVQKGQLNDNNMTPTAENDQRTYQVILVLGSIVVGIIIIATFTLVATMLIRKKTRAADDLNFDDNPNCRIITLQIRESNSISNLPGKERNIVYAILKSPRLMTEDATYVNTNFSLKSSLNKQPSEQRPGVLSGSVKYADIIFGSRVPHSKD